MMLMSILFVPTSHTYADVKPDVPARFLIDPVSGLAIYGYDPVAYFTEFEATTGKAEYSVEKFDMLWQFANEANRDRFLEAPERYVPVFGGYGVFSISKGLPATGNPKIWAILDNKLYFFHSAPLRQAWVNSPIEFSARALEKWPDLVKTLPK